MRHVRFEVANRLVKGLCRFRRFWREELERERRQIRPHNVGDMHDSASIFVPAATFGQLTRTDSRHNCKYARWKARAILWLWETDYGDSAGLRNLIQIRQQLDLIMIRAQDICFQRVIVFTRGDARIGVGRFVA